LGEKGVTAHKNNLVPSTAVYNENGKAKKKGPHGGGQRKK